MNKTAVKNYIRIPTEEYARLKQFQKYTEVFFSYFEHLKDVREAREDIKSGKVVSQEKFFQELGI